MIEFRSLAIARGNKRLFSEASLALHHGWHVGLCGRNGCGKSSLLALFTGNLSAELGECRFPSGWRIAHMAQEVPALSQLALDYVLAGDEQLMQAQSGLLAAEQSDDGVAIATAHAQLDAIDAWRAPARAAEMLAGLGFSAAEQQQPVAAFSGGWRMRLNLARTLMARADLMLLDEPTNHLDLDALVWLEGWLRSFPGTLLLISHDREFLDGVVDHVLHVENAMLTLYAGNYSAFESTRIARLAEQQSAYEKQQREVAHIQSYVDRFRAKATKARQAQSRLKALERLVRIAPAHVDSGFSFSIEAPARMPDPLLRLDEVSVGHGVEVILRDVTLALRPESRIGLIGPNGAGKTTLMETLAGRLPVLAGTLQAADNLQIGYFAQHQLDHLAIEPTPMAHMLRVAGSAVPELQLRSFLGGFGFHGDDVSADISRFSGGERVRLALALIAWRKPHLLLLDEPTNHLDLDMREALTMALQMFSGAVVLVSHDRHLLSTCVDDYLLVANGCVQAFEGDLSDYQAWLAQQLRAAASATTAGSVETEKVSRKDARRQAADRRAAQAPLRKRLQQLEKDVAAANAQWQQLEVTLADEKLYLPEYKEQLRVLLDEQRVLQQKRDALENEWLGLAEQIDA